MAAVTRPDRFGRLRKRLGRVLRALGPTGRVTVSLAEGQTLALEGARAARLECLEGAVWATGDGLDRIVPGGSSVAYPEGGRLVVSGRSGGARVRLGWM